jgi:hypothetical protein
MRSASQARYFILNDKLFLFLILKEYRANSNWKIMFAMEVSASNFCIKTYTKKINAYIKNQIREMHRRRDISFCAADKKFFLIILMLFLIRNVKIKNY